MKIKKLAAALLAAVMSLSITVTANAETIDNSGYDSSLGVPFVHDFEIGDGTLTYSDNDVIKSFGQLLNEYPDGSFYSKNGMACNCHDWCNYNKPNNPYTGETCNCINYDASIQCIAFAKYVYYNVKGKKWDANNAVFHSVINASAETAKARLKGTEPGSYVLVKSDYNSPTYHAFAVVDTNDIGIFLYDANSNARSGSYTYSKCQVRYEYLRWDDFSKQYSYIEKTVV